MWEGENMIESKRLACRVAYGANCYFLTSDGESCVIDPSTPPPAFIDLSTVKYVLLTHSHFDHILAIDEWVQGGAEVLIGESELSYLPRADLNCYRQFFGIDRGYSGASRGLKDGDKIQLGGDIITYRETPGHTPGSGIFISGRDYFVGDTVFAGGGYGRFDLPGGDYKKLFASIDRILGWDESAILYPGHGEKTSLFEFKKSYRKYNGD